MAKYFSKFPKLVHSNDNVAGTLVTNLMTRIKLTDSVLNNFLVYYKYDIQEGDTPEIIAEKYYGDAEKHWLVLLSNQIIDPFYEWPMSYQQFSAYIDEKYGSQAAALATNHHYEKIITSVDSLTSITTTNVYQIDLTAYTNMSSSLGTVSKSFGNGVNVTVTTSRREIDCYQYENELNESRRNIQLLEASYAYQVDSELNRLLSAEQV